MIASIGNQRFRRRDAIEQGCETIMPYHIKVLIRSMSQVTLTIALAATLWASAPSALRAEGLRVEPLKVMFAVPRQAKSKVAGFDWLAKRTPSAQIRIYRASTEDRLPRQIGRGSWICSPAGFGKKSRCFAN